MIVNSLTTATELSSAIKSNILQQTLVKAKLNFPVNAHHINATVEEAGCYFDCICSKFLYRKQSTLKFTDALFVLLEE